eukprot:763179-Hanusia_phi.AAC.6
MRVHLPRDSENRFCSCWMFGQEFGEVVDLRRYLPCRPLAAPSSSITFPSIPTQQLSSLACFASSSYVVVRGAASSAAAVAPPLISEPSRRAASSTAMGSDSPIFLPNTTHSLRVPGQLSPPVLYLLFSPLPSSSPSPPLLLPLLPSLTSTRFLPAGCSRVARRSPLPPHTAPG